MNWSDAAKKFNFIKIAEDGVPEIYADHHMLSTLRTCEAYFDLQILQNIGGTHRSWSLEWGQWIHKMMEYFYEYEKDLKHISIEEFVRIGDKEWLERDLDFFVDTKQSKNIGGRPGSLALLADYWSVYGNGQERIRIVGMELPFGKNKEVLIMGGEGCGSNLDKWHPFRSYLTGRIDMIVDDGHFIMPLDTKSTSYFDGTEASDFKPHDGMQGYAYALNTMLGEKFAKEGKSCNRTIINHIALRPGKDAWARFKRSYISYTPAEMEEFRLRNSATFSQIYQIIILERPVQWTTGIQCHNMYFHDCPFKSLHGIAPTSRDTILQAQYTQIEAWNPYIEKPAKEVTNVTTDNSASI